MVNKIQNHIIYRVQDPQGRGPYRPEILDEVFSEDIKVILDSHSGDPNRPLPHMDSIGRWPLKTEICGFISVKQALKWFPKYLLQELALYDFHLRQVKVECITAVSIHQCLAIKNHEEGICQS